FDLLKEKTVAALEIFCLAIPGLTYIFAVGVGLAGDPSLPAFTLIAMIVLFLLLAEIPGPSWRHFFRSVRSPRTIWLKLREDPSRYLATSLVITNFAGLLLTFTLIGPA